MVNFTVEVEDRVTAPLQKFAGVVSHPAPTVAKLAPDWLAEVEGEQFGTQGAAGASGRWKPLAQSTLRAKSRGGFPANILDRTGGLRNLMTRAGSLKQLMRVNEDGVTFELPPVGALHQRGTRRMPQRKVVDPSNAQSARFGERLLTEFMAQGRNAGFVTEG